MATIYSTPASTIKQRINKDVAVFLRDQKEFSIDDVLITAATPAVRADFKSIDQKSMYHVMIKMKLFLKGRQRFLNFSKEAVKEGLAKEWISMLEEDDKVGLLEEIAVIDHIEEDGTIVRKEPVCTNFANANIPDIRYGNASYETPSVKHPVKRDAITDIKPVEKLAEKLAPYIVWYKKWWKYMVNHESFKWNATNQFQRVFDINADDLAANLKEALSKEDTLLSGHMNFSKQMLLLNAKYSQEDIRRALEMLFDESVDLAKRIEDFMDQFEMINETNRTAGHLKQNAASHQNPHSISVYLAFAHPSKHYIYKETVWLDFKYETELDYPTLNWFTHKLVGYDQICNHIREVLIADKELVELHDKAYPDDVSDYHLLTQDFIYAIGVHFVDFDKRPAYFIEGEDCDA